MATAQSIARYEMGERVWVSALNKDAEISNRYWSGFTWMYSFTGEEITLGEMYLSNARGADPALEVALSQLITDNADGAFGEFLRELIFSNSRVEWAKVPGLIAKHFPEKVGKAL